MRLGSRAASTGSIIVVVYASQLSQRNPFIEFQKVSAIFIRLRSTVHLLPIAIDIKIMLLIFLLRIWYLF